MIRIVPEDWNGVAFVVEATDRGSGSGLSHSAITPTPATDMTIQDETALLPIPMLWHRH